MSTLRVLILVLLSAAGLYLWRMVRRDDGVQGVYALSLLLVAGALAAVEGVID